MLKAFCFGGVVITLDPDQDEKKSGPKRESKTGKVSCCTLCQVERERSGGGGAGGGVGYMSEPSLVIFSSDKGLTGPLLTVHFCTVHFLNISLFLYL